MVAIYLIVGLMLAEATRFTAAPQKTTPSVFVYIVLFWGLLVPLALTMIFLRRKL
jgi:hypothetical protein